MRPESRLPVGAEISNAAKNGSFHLFDCGGVLPRAYFDVVEGDAKDGDQLCC
jgi:hypothetical protein